MARYDLVLFDLLTALLDSWSLWNSVAGNDEDGLRWRRAYLDITYRTGAYRPYEDLVAEAAVAVGLSSDLADRLDARYQELTAWPDVVSTLTKLTQAGLPLGVVTNCSRRLGHIAAERVGIPFSLVVTAEDAGVYKPAPQIYLSALKTMGIEPSRCLFVAGSAYDLIGTAAVGMPTYWHDRIGMLAPRGAQTLAHERTLQALPTCCGIT
jgi:2-haloacid dehalogenase